VVTCLCLVAQLALAQAASVQASPAPARSDKLPGFGVQLDVGVPDGVGLSVLVRPFRFARFHAGVIENGASAGVRAGVTVMPWQWWITPVLTGEGGYYFAGDGNRLVRWIGSNPNFSNGFLDSVQYDFYNLHAGLEVGSPRRFLFMLHGGLTHIDLYDNSFSQGIQEAAQNSSPSGSTWSGGSASVHLNTLSIKFGFILYIG
jgi:hypothetical protein